MALDQLLDEISLTKPKSVNQTPRYGEETKRFDAFRDMFNLADAIIKYQKYADYPVAKGTPTLAAKGQEFNNMLGLLATTGRVSTPRQSELFNLPLGWQIPGFGVTGVTGGRSGGGQDELGDLYVHIMNSLIQQLGPNPSEEDVKKAIEDLHFYHQAGFISDSELSQGVAAFQSLIPSSRVSDESRDKGNEELISKIKGMKTLSSEYEPVIDVGNLLGKLGRKTYGAVHNFVGNVKEDPLNIFDNILKPIGQSAYDLSVGAYKAVEKGKDKLNKFLNELFGDK